jgi:hypothetical protein
MGGKVLIGLTDQNVYVGIGDVIGHRTRAENTANGPPPDGTGGILRVTQDGQTLPNSPLGNGDNTYSNLNFYYAYGMLNLNDNFLPYDTMPIQVKAILIPTATTTTVNNEAKSMILSSSFSPSFCAIL